MTNVLRYSSKEGTSGTVSFIPFSIHQDNMDNMAHMKVCGFLDTAWNPDYEKNPRELVKFLRAVSI